MKSPRMGMKPRAPQVVAEAVRGEAELTVARKLEHALAELREKDKEIATLQKEVGNLTARLSAVEKATGEEERASIEHIRTELGALVGKTVNFIRAAKIGKTAPGGAEAINLAEAIRAFEGLLHSTDDEAEGGGEEDTKQGEPDDVEFNLPATTAPVAEQDQATPPPPQEAAQPKLHGDPSRLTHFLKENLTMGEGSTIAAAALYREYTAACTAAGIAPVSQNEFKQGVSSTFAGAQVLTIGGRERYVGITYQNEA